MAKPKNTNKTGPTTTHKLFVTFRLPLALLVLFLAVYFVLAPGVPRLKGYQREVGVPVVPTDGAENYIELGPEGKAFIVDVANTQTSRERGLSGRTGLDQSHGMLFIFEEPSNQCFWMKDMEFDIDILWFDQDLKLVHIKHEATPASYPAESFCSPMPAKYAIEVVSGTTERLGLQLGDSFSQTGPDQ